MHGHEVLGRRRSLHSSLHCFTINTASNGHLARLDACHGCDCVEVSARCDICRLFDRPRIDHASWDCGFSSVAFGHLSRNRHGRPLAPFVSPRRHSRNVGRHGLCLYHRGTASSSPSCQYHRIHLATSQFLNWLCYASLQRASKHSGRSPRGCGDRRSAHLAS